MKLLKTLFGLPQAHAPCFTSASAIDFGKLDMRALPILSSHQLLELVGFESQLSNFYRIVGISDAHFDLLYRRPIHSFAEAVQLAPASENNHHCGPGGLLKHTLEVIHLALHIRRNYQLPIGGSPEDMAREEHHWTYGIFVACLFHDIGKVLSRFLLVLNMPDGQRQLWNPHSIPIQETGAASYGIVFHESPYKAHQRMSLTLYGSLLPQAARAWLAQHNEVMLQALAFLWGDVYESQVIGAIVTKADRESTAKNTDIAHAHMRFPDAKESLADKLINKLRQLLSEGLIKVNKDGGMGWIADEHTYLVCRPLAELLISSMKDIGAAGIPADPVRIYDVLQEHGFALPTMDGKAVWKVEVADSKSLYSHTLTCLKFKTRRLWLPVRLPQSFDGVIREISDHEIAPALSGEQENTPVKVAQVPVQEVRSQARAHTRTPKVEAALAEPEATMETCALDNEFGAEVENEPTLKLVNTISKSLVKRPTENKTISSEISIKIESAAEESRKPRETEIALEDAMGPADSIKTADWNEDVASAFWKWVCEGILNKTLATNTTKASVHFVADGIFLVSPRIFKHYCKHALLGEDAYSKLQKRFQRLKLHKKTPLTHLNVHPYVVDTGSRTARLNGWLVAYNQVFPLGAELPQINKFLRPIE